MRFAWIVACTVMSGGHVASADVSPSGQVRNTTGTTIEAQLGAGDIHGTCHEAACSSNAFPELVVGGSLGWWVTRTLVVQLRVVDSISREGSSVDNFVLLGVGVQYWASTRFWLGTAGGTDILAAKTKTGVALGVELRAGYVFLETGPSALSISADVSPSVTSDNLTTFALLLGYHYL